MECVNFGTTEYYSNKHSSHRRLVVGESISAGCANSPITNNRRNWGLPGPISAVLAADSGVSLMDLFVSMKVGERNIPIASCFAITT